MEALEPVAIAYETYQMFAEMYGIPLELDGKKKTFAQFRAEIKAFEWDHEIIGGLYF